MLDKERRIGTSSPMDGCWMRGTPVAGLGWAGPGADDDAMLFNYYRYTTTVSIPLFVTKRCTVTSPVWDSPLLADADADAVAVAVAVAVGSVSRPAAIT